MDMGKVFHGNESIPLPLLERVRKSNLKGELCDECGLLKDKFSEQYFKLVKIKMEMMSSLLLIQDKMQTAMETSKGDELRKLANFLTGPDDDGWVEKMDILEVLRSEAIQKCTRKLSAELPRPKLQNLSMQQVMNKKQKFQSNTQIQTGIFNSSFEKTDPAIDIAWNRVKTDFPDPLHADIDNSYYLENADMHGSASDSDDGNNGFVVKAGEKSIPYSTVKHRTFGNLDDSYLKEKRTKKSTTNVQSSSLFVIPSGSGSCEKPDDVSLDPETGRYKCCLCPSEFKYKRYAKTHHESVHLGVKYKCTICGRVFTQRSAYNLHHRTIHMGVRVQCRGCKKLFKLKHHLVAHQRKYGCNTKLTKAEMP